MQVVVKMVNETRMGDFYFRGDQIGTARALVNAGEYTRTHEFYVSVYDESIDASALAEEMFDLSNNPSRDNERAKRWGRVRSLSVGDIVSVNGVDYLCASMGWKAI